MLIKSKLFSLEDKLSYLVTLCEYRARYEDIEDSYEFKCIENAIKEYTDCNGVIIDGLEEPYIDHQSVPYDGINIINIYDEDAIIDFVFNKYISLKTTCD